MPPKSPNFGTIAQACSMVGGVAKPISKPSYYRGAQRGLYPKPIKVAPNISRVDLDRLAKMLRERADAAEPTAA